MVITMAKLRMAHASMHGTRKPPGPKLKKFKMENNLRNVKLRLGTPELVQRN